MNIFNRFFKKKTKQPEDDYKVTVTETSIKVEHPERATEEIAWQDIEEIKFINTDQGPWLPDVWLALLGKESGCLIPQGANNYNKVYDIISEYPGFNFENVIKSMSCSDNAEFDLWTKKQSNLS